MEKNENLNLNEREYPTTPHPYYVRNKPKTKLGAFFSRRRRLIINGLFQDGYSKCAEDNRNLFYEQDKAGIPDHEKIFKNWDEISIHCMLTVNRMIRKLFIIEEYKMYDCFEECERKFPQGPLKYFSFYWIRRIPCYRKCEDIFNDELKPTCSKVSPILRTYDFRYTNKKNYENLENIFN